MAGHKLGEFAPIRGFQGHDNSDNGSCQLQKCLL